MVDDGKQRQIVVRIAVEPAVPQCLPLFLHPAFQPRHLAFAVAWRARDPAGEAPVVLLRLGGDQVRNIELLGDRRGDEAVGRGDDDERIAVRTVQVHERTGGGRDHGQNLVPHVLPVPAVEAGAVVGGERFQGEREKLHDIERARLILGVVAIVLAFVFRAVDNVVLDQEPAPGVVAVAAQQRVVEVKDGEAQIKSLMKNSPQRAQRLT